METALQKDLGRRTSWQFCSIVLKFLPKRPLRAGAARQVPCPAEHYVGRDVGCELGSTAGFSTKRSLRHSEWYAADLKAAESAEKALCSGKLKVISWCVQMSLALSYMGILSWRSPISACFTVQLEWYSSVGVDFMELTLILHRKPLLGMFWNAEQKAWPKVPWRSSCISSSYIRISKKIWLNSHTCLGFERKLKGI